ncbi:hypothetical protein L198_06271 [Cryptococcus wingfieldii CBS 7118]|uniref:Uncharacterized protein n=1 Tax=Cryptococcus wingfieldii CBS 7118 TaxID=1295528 RepID=A0A1E3INS0_9TREE|nr:hypothetical protein L198_06271 [Cryptococcus wingfieldii CBS 7118]ODN90253.1 hypothetical protein L198_06271 [Cryptococcus wingfieldii CBS 7118]
MRLTPPYSVDEAIGATWTSIVHDGKQESPIHVYQGEMERFTSWAQPGSVRRVLRYDSDPPSPRDQPPSVHGTVESEPVNREFVVEGRLIKCFISRLENPLPSLCASLSTPPPSIVCSVPVRRCYGVEEEQRNGRFGGLGGHRLAYKSTVLLGYADEGMSMLLRSWFRDMENEQVAPPATSQPTLGAAASNPLLVASSGLIGAALGEEDMRFSSNEAELAHELPPVAVDLSGTNALSPHDGIIPEDD